MNTQQAILGIYLILVYVGLLMGKGFEDKAPFLSTLVFSIAVISVIILFILGGES